jgi:hypothetical protein
MQLIEDVELKLNENNDDMKDVIIPFLLVSTNYDSEVAKELFKMSGFKVNKDTGVSELEDVLNDLSKNELTKLSTLIK